MNIIFLSIGGLSDLGENAVYPDLLRYFRDKGHSVYVVCQHERRTGKLTSMEIEHGMNVLRVRTGNITKVNLIEKGISTLLIGVQFKKAINKYFNGVKFDLVLYSTPPITIANTVKYIKQRDKSVSYLMLKDIFPQNAIDIGMLSESGWKNIITKYFKMKEKNLYLQSDFIGCMSKANVDFLKNHNSYLKLERINICPNTINLSNYTNLDKNNLRDEFKLPRDKTIFIYGGNFGKPQDVDFILKVLNSNIDNENRYFVMCGSGTDFYKIKDYVKNANCKNVSVIDSLNKSKYNNLLNACDVGLLFLDHRFTIPNFPSRLLDYMNNSLPVFAATDKNTDVGKVILEGKFGWWCESNNIAKYNKILEEICENSKMIIEKGKNGREYLTNNYTTEQAYNAIMVGYRNSIKDKVE